MNQFKRIGARLTASILAAVTMMTTAAFAAPGTVNAVGGLRLRNGVGTSAAIITTLPNGAQIDVADVTAEGWYQVSYKNLTGYVSGDYVVMNEVAAAPQLAAAPAEEDTTTYGKVTEGPLNVRTAPSTEGERVKRLAAGSVVEIIAEVDGWYQIADGYVSGDYVKIIDAAEAEAAKSASKIVEYALQFVGYPYVYGGASPSGFDCSGFVKYVLNHFGVSVNRTASAQMDNGIAVSMSELLPGDIVFFKKAGTGAKRASHVGIYIGNGQFVHASTARTGVIISDMDYAYYTTGFVGGRRML